MRSVLPFVVALLGVASAIPSNLKSPYSNYVVHETRVSEPGTHWTKRRLHPSMVLPMRIGLTQQNLHRMEEMLMSVSDPESPKYAQHFTPKEVVDTFAPSKETISSVANWLVDSGFSRDRIRLSANKGWIHLNASTSEAENLLNTEYHVYTHPSGDTHIGCHNYSVPGHLRPHVDLIQPTVHFIQRRTPNPLLKRTESLGQPSSGNGLKMLDSPVAPTTPDLTNCSGRITPDCVRALYKISYTTASASSSTDGNTLKLVVVEVTPNSYLQSDLDMFFRNFSTNLVGMGPYKIFIDGGELQTSTQNFAIDGEASLDIQYTMSLTYPQGVDVSLLQAGDPVEGASFGNILDAFDKSYCGGDDPSQDAVYPDPFPGGSNVPEDCGTLTPPEILSVSYVMNEGNVTSTYAQRQCGEYAKLGMMGTTLIFCSGDNGVAGLSNNGSQICQNSTHQTDGSGNGFNPQFPSTCPYVTSVGATQMVPGSSVTDPEVAANQFGGLFTSSGGFSNIFPLAAYQSAAVKGYLQANPPPFANQFNNSGNARGFPDVSANGANIVIAVNGQFRFDYGTSASAPIISSIVALINDARKSAGKKPVGFINPALYSAPFQGAFNDITKGSNPGCGTPGFTAATGWDPVTGLGTPNFELWKQNFLQLP